MDMAVCDVVTPSNQYKIHFCLAACALLQPVIILLKFMYKWMPLYLVYTFAVHNIISGAESALD